MHKTEAIDSTWLKHRIWAARFKPFGVIGQTDEGKKDEPS